MSNEDWLTHMHQLHSRLKVVPRNDAHGGLRAAIAEVWHSITAAPNTTLHLYKQMPESDIAARANEVIVRSGRSDFGLPAIASTADGMEALRDAMVILRALETEFRHLYIDGRRPSDPNSDWRVTHRSGDLFLIPIARLTWKEVKPPEEDRRSFNQRALLHIRLVPTVIEGHPVTIHFPDIASRDGC